MPESGRWQASYVDPAGVRRVADQTFPGGRRQRLVGQYRSLDCPAETGARPSSPARPSALASQTAPSRRPGRAPGPPRPVRCLLQRRTPTPRPRPAHPGQGVRRRAKAFPKGPVLPAGHYRQRWDRVGPAGKVTLR